MIINTIDELKNIKNKSNMEITLNISDNIDSICDVLEDLNPTIKVNNISGDITNELNKRNTYIGFNTSILNKVKQICKNILGVSDYVVDATIGNGLDTLYLCNLVKKGKVFGFDIQDSAIDNTTKLLKSNNVSNYILYKISHSNMDEVLSEYSGKIKLILFNLGYLPKGDKTITTKADTTLEAIKRGYRILMQGGVILLVFYPHEEGVREATVVKNYLIKNDIQFGEYHNTFKKYAPYLVVISKPIGQ